MNFLHLYFFTRLYIVINKYVFEIYVDGEEHANFCNKFLTPLFFLTPLYRVINKDVFEIFIWMEKNSAKKAMFAASVGPAQVCMQLGL